MTPPDIGAGRSLSVGKTKEEGCLTCRKSNFMLTTTRKLIYQLLTYVLAVFSVCPC